MSSDNIYYSILDYDGSEDANWFNYAWRSIEEADFEDVERLLEELDSREGGLGDLEISLLIQLNSNYDDSDLRPYTLDLVEEYDIEDDGPSNSL
jgi:hypothetical protein